MELGNRAIGARGELIVAEEFLRRGYAVYTPLVDNGADLVVDLNGQLLRVQVKTYSGDDTGHVFKLKRRGPLCTGWEDYGENAVDWYALCWLSHGYVALVPAGGLGSVYVSFTEHGAARREEIEIGAVLARLVKED